MKNWTRLLASATLSVVAALTSLCAVAQTWPAKPVTIIVPYPPGGASDVTARLIAQRLTEAWGQSVIVENRPGANGNIAATYVAAAKPDGYTLLMGNVGPNAISLSLYKSLAYGVKSFAPISQTGTVPIVILANPDAPFRTLQELVAYAKANPDKLNYGSAGVGSSTHLTAELLKTTAGIRMMHVPYKGDSPAIVDVEGGQIPLMLATTVSAVPQIRTGRVRAIAITTPKRSLALPDVPTVAESGYPNFDTSSWGGLLAPAGTPPEVIAKAHDAVVTIMDMPDTRKKLGDLGIDIVSSTPEAFGKYMLAEEAKWGRAVKSSGASLD